MAGARYRAGDIRTKGRIRGYSEQTKRMSTLSITGTRAIFHEAPFTSEAIIKSQAIGSEINKYTPEEQEFAGIFIQEFRRTIPPNLVPNSYEELSSMASTNINMGRLERGMWPMRNSIQRTMKELNRAGSPLSKRMSKADFVRSFLDPNARKQVRDKIANYYNQTQGTNTVKDRAALEDLGLYEKPPKTPPANIASENSWRGKLKSILESYKATAKEGK